MRRGSILSYNREHGWGFIASDDGDWFFHVSGLVNRKFARVNEPVEFEVSERNGRPIAINVRFTADAATPVNNGGQHGRS